MKTRQNSKAVDSPRGYSLPLSPSGVSSMLTPPPWHFAGEVTMVELRVDPDAARSFLPAELDLGADPGAAAFVFADWAWCSTSGRELREPRSSQFGEFLVLLRCEYNGRALARCPYAWVDSAVPMMRGWLQGMPKQFGEIGTTRPKRVGRTGPRPGGSGNYTGTLSVEGRRVIDLSVEAASPVRERPLLHDVPLVHSRVQPPWVMSELNEKQGRKDWPLMTSHVEGVEFSEILAGDAHVTFQDVLDPDFASLEPIEIGKGYVFDYAETLVGGLALE
ncbi:acetoacetate decarboxylase family protein [Arthrobacter sp. UM1]|uniref:acetoacetate decarboxylase family protein n=1 Tax=Arthrobacter sp. UM1 TaxID=2766776 RepID=UPI001CF719DE|nr:acetoacetate decarboxylase family protein [Arthrobacter sp. UM1]MCB4208804.1 acetoacetate decarboxylase family protein [Arthrobacter sp. UM1]